MDIRLSRPAVTAIFTCLREKKERLFVQTTKETITLKHDKPNEMNWLEGGVDNKNIRKYP